MARITLDDDEYRGGALAVATPKRKRHPCYADGCPMPGTIFTSGTDKTGACAWHYGVVGMDVPKVTRALTDWACLAYEVNEARRTLTDPDVAAKPAVIAERMQTAWERLQPLVPGYEQELQPSTIRDTAYRESYGDWAKRLEAFLGARVVEVLGVKGPRRHERTARAHAFAEGAQP